MNKVLKIEIDFNAPVTFPLGWESKLDTLLTQLTKAYEKEHPDRVMWPAGMGYKIINNYFIEDKLEFDESVYHIEVAERENFDWPCKKCGFSQGNHKSCLINAPAGDCDYEPADKMNLDWKGHKRRKSMSRKTKLRSRFRLPSRIRPKYFRRWF